MGRSGPSLGTASVVSDPVHLEVNGRPFTKWKASWIRPKEKILSEYLRVVKTQFND